MAMYGEHAEPGRTEKIREGLVSGGSVALAIGGAAAVVLSIIGLAHQWPVWMATISTIIIGAALLLEGLAVAGRQIELLSRTGGTIEQTEMAGGLTAEFLAGCAGLVLGIISIFNVFPAVLMPCALIIFGSTLVFGSRSRPYLSEGEYRPAAGRPEPLRKDVPAAEPSAVERPMERLSVLLSPVFGAHTMVGLACMALGICALANLRPILLTLVGLLTFGFVLFLGGTALTTRFVYRRAHR